MSYENDDFYDEIPELYEEEIVEEEKPKRKRTDKQRNAGLKNLELARQKRSSLAKAKKQQAQEYDQYIVDPRDNKLSKRNYKREVNYNDKYYDDDGSDYSDYSDDDDVYEIRPKKGKSKQKAPSKKELKEQDKLARIENILMGLVKAQKTASKSKKVVKNTVIQVPKSAPPEIKTGGSLEKLIKLF
jgi:hypothetical protein